MACEHEPQPDAEQSIRGFITMTSLQVFDLLRRYADRAPDTTDGVRVEWEDAWLHVRASNTEPLLRIIVESHHSDRATCP